MNTSKKGIYILIAIIVIVVVGLLIRGSATDQAMEDSAEAPAEEISTVKTATPSTPAGAGAKKSARAYIVDGVAVVYYTNTGFDPYVAETARGGNVRFINESDYSLRLAKLELPGNDGYAGLNQNATLGEGETYTTNFTQLGTWGYYNLNRAEHRGAVVVIDR